MKKPASPPVSAHTGDGPHNGWLHGFAHPFTLLAWRKHLPLSISALLIGLFALSHGYAHGSGMPPSTALPSYAAGFMLATMLLHLCGIGLALLCKKFAGIRWIRFSGIIIAGYGGFLLIP
ncbi:MAG: HupE/UreJ family protein [Nitrosomonas sp.]|nr:HupE/UreJ family protein [Nitrosomonas sp.]